MPKERWWDRQRLDGPKKVSQISDQDALKAAEGAGYNITHTLREEVGGMTIETQYIDPKDLADMKRVVAKGYTYGFLHPLYELTMRIFANRGMKN